MGERFLLKVAEATICAVTMKVPFPSTEEVGFHGFCFSLPLPRLVELAVEENP